MYRWARRGGVTVGSPQDVTRVVEAVHGLPRRSSPGDQACALARALGEQLHADSVTITVWPSWPAATDTEGAAPESGPHEYRWTADGLDASTADAGRVRLGDDEDVAEVCLHPAAAAESLRGWPELLTATRLLLSDIQAQLTSAAAAKHIGRAAARLTDARQRAAGEMEQQRYRLERDLHDGAQHHMVALQMSLAMVEHHLGTGDPAEASRHLVRLRHLLAGTEDVLRDTATGLLSLPLTDHGLAIALRVRLGGLETVDLDIAPSLVGRRYPPEVEATVYLACLEAVSNAHKHAPGAAVTLSLRTGARGLGFEVADTGPGFDARGREPLRHLAARLASIGGTLRVRSSPAGGTQVTGFVAI